PRFRPQQRCQRPRPAIPSPLMSLYRRVLAYYRPDLGPTVTAIAFTVLANLFNVMRPWPLGFIMDKLLPAGATPLPHHLRLWQFDLSGWSLPSILALVCLSMVLLHLLAGGIGYI